MTGSEFSLFAHGGPMLWVILALAATAAVLFLERTLYLHRGQIRSKPFLDGIKNTLERRRLVEALTLCEETPGPVAAVVKAALRNAGRDAQDLKHAVQEAAIVEVPALERRLGSLAAIAQVAPLVGLLGTVIGVMTTFHAFMQGGQYATSFALARGMWQALIAVAGSLLLAIPTHLAYHFLTGRVRAVVRDVEWAAHEIVQYLTTEYKGRGVEPVEAAPEKRET
ncbi:MotA/TolQ/ExbB proton channel family protein [Nibricoccus sp. IMCC34717]|uniref:MotA/TolQ/ExbB proton channel family protein n=1 Tax=Nibricoccus sp. IMCC34717 TaxID=3034021 RepID=UPI00384F125E